jgi:DNA-binding beta-propeller fold protein YncE
MAEGQVKQILEKEVTCALCLDLFKEPKKLPCDHVYCRDCLRGLALRSLDATISCPECRTVTQVPDNDVNNFPTAFRINRFIEAFQHVQGARVETTGLSTDSPVVTEMCQVHPTQQLAIYCETCKKQLCRDCVLMTNEHSTHEYGFFEKVAPKYRKQLTSEMSQVTARESSISSALGEIVAAETNVENHAQKCQDDIEHAFEELFSVLQVCKRTMKDEATAYYSSLTGVFDQQKERLKEIQGKIKSVAASVDTILPDDDKSFLMRMGSTFEGISNLQKKFQAASLTVTMPQLIAMPVVDTDTFTRYTKTNCSLYKLADAKMCSIDSSPFIDAKLFVGQQLTFTLTLHDSSGNISVGENKIDVNIQENCSMNSKLEPISQGHIKVTLTLKRRGQHQLSVKVNGAHIKDSPFTVTVQMMPPNLLSRPVAIISELDRPASLVYSQAEDKIFATILGEHRVMKFEVDSQFCVTQHEFIKIDKVHEITHDAALDCFFATTLEHQLHKLSSDGKIIKTVGQKGKRNAEFEYPNGLRVSKERELYICDSKNNCVQVFDLGLNFKRSFGKKGVGKGQFDFPADVDFDTNGNIYVTDRSNHRIQVFTCAERHLRTILLGNKANVSHPMSLIIHDGNMYVTDCFNHSVCVINISGAISITTTFGVGYLHTPKGITIDKAGFVYVTMQPYI